MCGINAICTEGTQEAVCTCEAGFNGDGKTCTDTDECSNSTLNECHELATCNNGPGGYSCICKTGHTGDGKNKCESEFFLTTEYFFANFVYY